jgi:hypothetical protein
MAFAGRKRWLLGGLAVVLLPAPDVGADGPAPPPMSEVLRQTELFAVARITRLKWEIRSACVTRTEIHLRLLRRVAGLGPMPETLVFAYTLHADPGPPDNCPRSDRPPPHRAPRMKTGARVLVALAREPKGGRLRAIGTFDLRHEAKLKRLFLAGGLNPMGPAGQGLFCARRGGTVFHAVGCKEADCGPHGTRFGRVSAALAAGHSPHRACVRQGMKGADVPLSPNQPRSEDRRCNRDADCKFRPRPACSCSPCGTYWARAINLVGYRALMKRWERCPARACPRCKPTVLGKQVRCIKGQCTVR